MNLKWNSFFFFYFISYVYIVQFGLTYQLARTVLLSPDLSKNIWVSLPAAFPDPKEVLTPFLSLV